MTYSDMQKRFREQYYEAKVRYGVESREANEILLEWTRYTEKTSAGPGEQQIRVMA